MSIEEAEEYSNSVKVLCSDLLKMADEKILDTSDMHNFSFSYLNKKNENETQNIDINEQEQ